MRLETPQGFTFAPIGLVTHTPVVGPVGRWALSVEPEWIVALTRWVNLCHKTPYA